MSNAGQCTEDSQYLFDIVRNCVVLFRTIYIIEFHCILYHYTISNNKSQLREMSNAGQCTEDSQYLFDIVRNCVVLFRTIYIIEFHCILYHYTISNNKSPLREMAYASECREDLRPPSLPLFTVLEEINKTITGDQSIKATNRNDRDR